MALDKILTKQELMRQMKRFLEDEDRGISKALFADLAGLSKDIIEKVFWYETMPISYNTQVRISRALESWRKGDVAIMRNRDKTKFIQFRKKSNPPLTKNISLTMKKREIKLNVGIKNLNDYSDIDFFDEFNK